MHLGAFSVSLTVADIATSHAFYEKLGFSEAGGDQDQGWLVLRSGDTTIGLFQGMFDKNLMTFNPGWGPQAQPLAEPFEDVRAIQARLKAAGVALIEETDPEGSGPGFITLEDPDGNPILIDQHV
ncbi:MAG TPA: glyoxalase [Maritimibacter sp.]|nr:glyoxalase [Maritimibacter sp.]